MARRKSPRNSRSHCAELRSAAQAGSPRSKCRRTREAGAWRSSARITARIPSVRGKCYGRRHAPAPIRSPSGPRMRKETRSPTSRSGIQADICGTESSGKNSWSEARHKTEVIMRIRKRVVVLILLALSTLATAALYADFQSGYYSPTGAANLAQEAPPKLSLDGTYEVGMYPIYPPIFPSGDGVLEVKAYCNTCHGARYITTQPPLPAAVWEAEVNKMANTYGASIPDDAKQKIIQYLQTHFTPETRKKY